MELFYIIANEECAAARRAVLERGVKELVAFRNVHYDEVRQDFEARGGARLPALWDGAHLHQGLAAVLEALPRTA